MKRLTALLLSLLLCVSLLPAALAADDWKLVDADTGETNVLVAVPYGEGATMTVAVQGGADVTYTWYQVDPSNHSLYISIDGANGDSYTVSSVTGFDKYQCVAYDADGTGHGVYYDLAVDNGFTAVDAETGEMYSYRTVTPGGSIELSVQASAADPEGIAYQWYIYAPVPGEDHVERQDIEGATAASYTVEGVTEVETYYCEVTDKYGTELEVSFDLSIESDLRVWAEGEPYETDNVSRLYEKGATPTLTVGADASESCKPFSYTWYEYAYKTDPDGFSYWSEINEPVGDGPSFTAPAVTERAQYACRVSDRFGNEERVTFQIGVENHFQVEAESYAVSAPFGENATMKVVASADEGPLTYAWYRIENWERVPVEGENGPTLTVKAEKQESFVCEVSDSYGSAKEASFRLSVENHFTAEAESYEVSAPFGEDVALKVNASADEGPLTYKWYRLEDWLNELIEGEDGPTLTVKAEKQERYTCVVSDPYSEESVSFQVTVENGFTAYAAGTAEETATVHVPENGTATLVVDAHADEGELTCQWSVYERAEGHSWGEYVPVEGADGPDLDTKSITEETSYMCEVTDIYGSERTVHFTVNVEDGFSLVPGEGFTVVPGSLYPNDPFLMGKVDFQCVYAKPGDTVTLTAKAASLSDSAVLTWTRFGYEESEPLAETGESLTVENVQGDTVYILKASNKYNEDAWLYFKIITSGETPAGDPLDANGDGAVNVPDAAVFLTKGGADSAWKAAQILQSAVRG